MKRLLLWQQNAVAARRLRTLRHGLSSTGAELPPYRFGALKTFNYERSNSKKNAIFLSGNFDRSEVSLQQQGHWLQAQRLWKKGQWIAMVRSKFCITLFKKTHLVNAYNHFIWAHCNSGALTSVIGCKVGLWSKNHKWLVLPSTSKSARFSTPLKWETSSIQISFPCTMVFEHAAYFCFLSEFVNWPAWQAGPAFSCAMQENAIGKCT